MECSDIPPMKDPIICREMRPMSLDERRQLLERQSWINNVKRCLGMTDVEAQKAWLKVKTEK